MTLKLVEPVAEKIMEVPDLSPIILAQEEFHSCFEIPVNESTQELYVRLVDEEHEEWIEEYYDPNSHEHDELKELTDLLYVTSGLAYQHGFKLTQPPAYNRRKRYDDEITDYVSEIVTGNVYEDTVNSLIASIFGYACYMGWDLMKAYTRVHASNMSKLGEDGKPVRRADGKVLKGPNYIPPSLKDLINGNS